MHSDRPSRSPYLGGSIASLYRRSQAWLARELEPLGLGPSTWPPLLALYARDGRSQEELALHAGVDKAAMKRSVDSLVEAGYVVREEDPADARAWRVRLTPKARRRRPAIEARLAEWEGQLTEGFTAKEVGALRALLEAAARNVGAGCEGGKNGT